MISSNKHRLRRGSRVLLEGKIFSLDGTIDIDVKIRELSATGAILRVPPNLNIPEKFSLLVIQTESVTQRKKVGAKANG
jgi:hypothetical protein